VIGSLNANKRHWYKAAQMLARTDHSWLERLVTRREPPAEFKRALARQLDDIKVVISSRKPDREDWLELRQHSLAGPYVPNWSGRRCWCWPAFHS
jgi:glucose dehydrogenase-like enzyme